jgi:hypothetical protein
VAVRYFQSEFKSKAGRKSSAESKIALFGFGFEHWNLGFIGNLVPVFWDFNRS